jgi:uncharacterized protein YndB with AHSA1/START domain
MLRKILIGIVILIAIPFIAALFVDKDYAVEREIVISRPKAEVFEYIRYLKNQDYFSKWAMMDPNMKKSYTGTDGTVGFVSAWDSDKDDVGKGEQEIVKMEEGERIDYELRFLVPFESTSPAYMTTESISDNETKVAWGFAGHMAYPMNLLIPLMSFEKIIGDDLATGLGNLKVELEK